MATVLVCAMVIGGGCWAFKTWILHAERQQVIQKLEQRQRETGEVIEPEELKQLTCEIWKAPDVTSVVKTGMNKWVVIAVCCLYIIFPFDILPDFIPVLGWGDDLAAAVIAVRAMLS